MRGFLRGVFGFLGMALLGCITVTLVLPSVSVAPESFEQDAALIKYMEVVEVSETEGGTLITLGEDVYLSAPSDEVVNRLRMVADEVSFEEYLRNRMWWFFIPIGVRTQDRLAAKFRMQPGVPVLPSQGKEVTLRVYEEGCATISYTKLHPFERKFHSYTLCSAGCGRCEMQEQEHESLAMQGTKGVAEIPFRWVLSLSESFGE